MIWSAPPERKRPGQRLEPFGPRVAPVVRMGRPAHCPYRRRSLAFAHWAMRTAARTGLAVRGEHSGGARGADPPEPRALLLLADRWRRTLPRSAPLLTERQQAG